MYELWIISWIPTVGFAGETLIDLSDNWNNGPNLSDKGKRYGKWALVFLSLSLILTVVKYG